VCPQLRPYRCYFFTDDAQMLAVGTKLKIMSLRNWRRLTNRMRLRMAIAEKRSLGTWCKWIGVLWRRRRGGRHECVHKESATRRRR
jgi:hypothetical protein